MLNADFKEIISRFNDASVEYLIVGAYAVAAHGLPRVTGAIDLWVNPSPSNAHRVWVAVSAFGAPLGHLAANDFATLDTVVQLGVAPNRIDIVTSLEAVTFEEAWPDRLRVTMEGVVMNVVGREHLLRHKRVTARLQDLADVDRLTRLRSP